MAKYVSKYTGEEIESILDKSTISYTKPSDGIPKSDLSSSIQESLNDISNKVDKISGKQLSTEDFTTALKNKLNSLSNYDDTTVNNAISGLQSQINTLVSGNASTAIESFNEIIAFLDGIQDTQDLSSIVASIEQQIAGKMDKVTLATVATSGSYSDLTNKPTIPAEQVNADWNATSGKAQILNKPTIPSAVTESTVSGWGFTKNTGTYSKPSTGIPKSDLASDVQASLDKTDIIVTNKSDLDELYKDVPEGTKAVVVNTFSDVLGVNLFDFIVGNVEGVEEVLLHPEAYTLKISSVDTNIELPISDTRDVRVELPFNNKIYIDMGADLTSIHYIYVQKGYNELVWDDGYWLSPMTLIDNEMPLSILMLLDANALAGLMTIAPALIVDFVGTKTITEYVKNGDNWEVWSKGESGLSIQLSNLRYLIYQDIPTKTSQLKNDSNFVTSDNIKTINGQSILGEGDIVISGGGSSSGSGAYAEVNHGTSDTTFTLTPNTFHVWDEVNSLILTLGSNIEGVANEYLFQFTCDSDQMQLTLPDNIIFNDELILTKGYVYQVSILKNFAIVLSFKAPAKIISFTINESTSGNNYEYTCEEGMTWAQFANSSYNSNIFSVDYNPPYAYMYTQTIYNDASRTNMALSTDVILNQTYYIRGEK